jgi:hypothetical protein
LLFSDLWQGQDSNLCSVPAILFRDASFRERQVLNAPGSTISTLIPNGATSTARASDRPSRANLVAE